jgi:hypothetical protein
MGDLLTRLGDDDCFSLRDAIEKLGDVCSGFGERDVGSPYEELSFHSSINPTQFKVPQNWGMHGDLPLVKAID